MLLCLLIGCGSTSDQPTNVAQDHTAAEVSDPVSRTVPSTRMPRCGAPETPALNSYLEATEGDGVVRHLEVLRDPRNGVWATDSHIRMPMHHATAIRWTNLDDLPLLADVSDARLRFGFTLVTRNTRQVPGERAWRTEYTAEVSRVCEVSGDVSRATGFHLPDVHAPSDECGPLEDAVMESVQAAAHCTSDAECVVREAPACDLRGLGCSWMVVRRDASVEPILEAIRAHRTVCIASSCDCPMPPSTARCVDGACTAP